MRTSPSNISCSLFFPLIFSCLISTYFWLSLCPSSLRSSRFTVVATLGALVLLSRTHAATVLPSEPHTKLTTQPWFQSQWGVVCLPLLGRSLPSLDRAPREPNVCSSDFAAPPRVSVLCFTFLHPVSIRMLPETPLPVVLHFLPPVARDLVLVRE